jgi:quercetin dioxygenase-like cupin family protein
MARPHIEFIQAQALPWQALGPNAARPGAEAKVLSFDPETRACTAILRYPKGWSLPRAHYLDSDEELYVLDGALWIGGVEYRTGDYAYLPAGLPRPSMNSPAGASVMTFFEGPHTTVYGEAPVGLYDPARLIAKIESAAMPWGDPSDPVVAATANNAGRKLLRQDPKTGERTWLLKFGPDDPAKMTRGRLEVHPVAEEVFLIAGEISMPMGTLKPGAYFWRPPHIPHGPVGTRKGLFGLFRCKGGPLTTEWSKDETPIDWNPAYRPYLPEPMKHLASAAYDPALPY